MKDGSEIAFLLDKEDLLHDLADLIGKLKCYFPTTSKAISLPISAELQYTVEGQQERDKMCLLKYPYPNILSSDVANSFNNQSGKHNRKRTWNGKPAGESGFLTKRKIELLGINSFHVNCGYEEGGGNAKGYDTKQKATGNGTNSTCDGEQDHSSQFGVTWGLDTSDEASEDDAGKDTGIREGCSSLIMKILSWNCRGMGHARVVQSAKSMVLLNKKKPPHSSLNYQHAPIPEINTLSCSSKSRTKTPILRHKTSSEQHTAKSALSLSLSLSLSVICKSPLKSQLFKMSTMKFCRECNNILYPKEDKEQKILLYACRNCDHQILLGILPDKGLTMSDALSFSFLLIFRRLPITIVSTETRYTIQWRSEHKFCRMWLRIRLFRAPNQFAVLNADTEKQFSSRSLSVM
ncbi:hypothetical protein RHGRI_003204 [Rhododendron griersonianum]|uniref:DNA-directed RNA polymerase II subunit RPB9-like zinc ribbon domain-containing protein n=1 Tax=Rhododendron griersonianum TaxID=479676 RepID=A0AAV6L563_9ERIC|nr:hypothetical protein RHGRI_003204 [Rhododendron griersonianum]